MKRKNCVLLPAAGRSATFSSHIHRTWGPPFSASLYCEWMNQVWNEIFKLIMHPFAKAAKKRSNVLELLPMCRGLDEEKKVFSA